MVTNSSHTSKLAFSIFLESLFAIFIFYLSASVALKPLSLINVLKEQSPFYSWIDFSHYLGLG
jgi:hypothetical protein